MAKAETVEDFAQFHGTLDWSPHTSGHEAARQAIRAYRLTHRQVRAGLQGSPAPAVPDGPIPEEP
ncbi:hypothetical protein ACFRQM_15315 [Streptomyces sp. NPDC056831]|uniref:hypothetical protein n=1 Tax=Streptomyces sp. NPDC056831 TaxID=3345954 RepID=UPI0036CD7EA4